MVTELGFTTQRSRLRTLAFWLDAGIRVPGTKFRFGLDPIIGLVPGLGDGVGAVLSTAILLEAASLGVSRVTLFRMALNIVIDSLIGAVPVLGDAFDFAWKSNLKNVALLERSLNDPEGARTGADWIIVGSVVAGVLVLSLGLAAGSALLVTWLLHTLFR